MRLPSFESHAPWIFLLLYIALIALSMVFSQPGGDTMWYTTLSKSSLTPPDWIFGPVWALLYFLMGVSVFLVARARTWSSGHNRLRWIALLIFGVQLGLNILWSVLFFGLQEPAWALVDIILLLGGILATMGAFWRFSRLATWLLLPYLLWVSFATYLNIAIVVLN
mgnify:CR=1 FL=1